jgi:hypothetical protein
MIHKNDEHRKKYIHQYYLDHADIMKDRSRKYYADHKEERSAKMKAWRIENHEYVLEKDITSTKTIRNIAGRDMSTRKNMTKQKRVRRK